MLIRTPQLWMILGLLSIILWSLSLYAADDKSKPQSIGLASFSAQAKVVEKISKKQKEIINEAVDAIVSTKKALTALANGKHHEALNALEKAVGELEVALARDPNLALAAIDTQITIHDLYSSLKDIKQARKQAEEYLENNQIQKARNILSGLASEVIISVISIPLATYPKTIKEAIPLIDAGKTEEAKTTLRVALNSLAVTNYIIPLPIMRAEENLVQAEALAEKKDRAEVESISITHFLDQIRFQLTMAEALGYGSKDDYKLFFKYLDEVNEKTEGNKFYNGYFKEIRKFLSELTRSYSGEK